MSEPTKEENLKFKVRGRFTRDPAITDKGNGKMVFGRIAANFPYTDRNGDLQMGTRYVELKVFNSQIAEEIAAQQPAQGDRIVVTGRADIDEGGEEYTDKNGEVKLSQPGLVITLEDPSVHTVHQITKKADNNGSE